MANILGTSLNLMAKILFFLRNDTKRLHKSVKSKIEKKNYTKV